MIAVDDRGRGARLARRDEGAYCWYVTEEQRSRPGLKIRHIVAYEIGNEPRSRSGDAARR